MEKELVTSNGFVAFLDILGYSNILENNSPEYIAATVFRVLAEARGFAQKRLPKITKFKALKNFDFDRIGFLSFSDSILITIDLTRIESADLEDSLLIYMLFCSFVSRMMHENGLPVRGGIDYGDYVMIDSFIAGVPIIESYKLGGQIDMEGVVFTKRAADEMLKILEPSEYGLHHTVVEYLVQRKDGVEQKHWVLSPSPCTTPIYGELRQYVLHAFWMHNKDIPTSVRRKVDNTEQFLRFLKTFHDHLFVDERPTKKPAAGNRES